MPWDRVPNLNLLNTKQMLIVQDEKAANTSAGDFTSGAWYKRTLNTVKTNTITGASVASSQITLAAGTYYVQAEAPAFKVDYHQAKLYNTTSSADILLGTIGYAGSTGDYVNSVSRVTGVFTLSASSVLELQHRCFTTRATAGLGAGGQSWGTNVFAVVNIWRVST